MNLNRKNNINLPVLRNDPGMGVIRHADAGYDIALDTLRSNGLSLTERLK